jgi:hypothetical protein
VPPPPDLDIYLGCTCLWYRLITGCLVQVDAWWMHLFMVQVDYMLFSISWCMVDALVYGTC